MKSSYITEVLIIVFSGFSGSLFFKGGFWNYLFGFLVIFMVSYFLVSLLKEQTILEFTESFKN